MAESVAERRGWTHSGRRELFQVINRVAHEAGDPQLRRLFQVANSLHMNFYENWLSHEYIEDSMAQLKEFITKIEAA